AKQIDSPPGNEQTADSAKDRQYETFAEELPNDSRATRAERSANRDLALPRGCAGEQKVGDVRARDQQHKRNCGKNRDQRRTYVPDDVIMERIHALRSIRV